LVELHTGHMQGVQADEQIATRAVGRFVMAARSRARRRLGQRRGPSERCAWSPLILRASTSLSTQPRSHRRAAHPHRNSEEPTNPGGFTLLERPHDLYAKATDEARRDLNLASYTKLWIEEHGVIADQKTEPVRELHEAAMAYAVRTVGKRNGAPQGRAFKDPE